MRGTVVFINREDDKLERKCMRANSLRFGRCDLLRDWTTRCIDAFTRASANASRANVRPLISFRVQVARNTLTGHAGIVVSTLDARISLIVK